MADNSVDSIVTDPPYGLKFMGKKWDYDVPSVEIWKECLRVLKPGGHALIACGTRTQHRMCLNIEDAGFEIRDVITWLYGSGFPKSANQGDGIGTALKPACEFWTLARKPLSEKTVAKNIERWGTGGINIDACRVGMEIINNHPAGSYLHNQNINDGRSKEVIKKYIEKQKSQPNTMAQGRFPANLILDQEAGALLDVQSGHIASGYRKNPSTQSNSLFHNNEGAGERGYKDSGGASRFFYCAKVSKSERNAGLEGMPDKILARSNGSKSGNNDENPDYNENAKSGYDKRILTKNHHPTVKPLKLMEYLIKLVTPKNGVVLDPFMGSGSTGIAAKNEGLKFIGIEMNEEYFNIAHKRIENA